MALLRTPRKAPTPMTATLPASVEDVIGFRIPDGGRASAGELPAAVLSRGGA